MGAFRLWSYGGSMSRRLLPTDSPRRISLSRVAFERGLRVLSRLVGSRFERRPDLTQVQKIIILQVQNVGDSVAFTPALRAIRDRFPNAQIDLLCSPISAEFYAKCPYVDHILLDQWFHSRVRHLGSELRLIRALRSTDYDVAICDASEISASHAVAALMTGASTRIGFSTNDRGFLYTVQLDPRPDVDFIEENLAVAAALGAETSSREVECYFDDHDVQYADALTPAHDGKPLIAIHPVSNWQSKTWVPERWASVADTLVRQGATVIFIGAAREQQYIDAIRKGMQTSAASLAGATTLPQLAALLSRCQLFVGTDSGPRHVAAGTARRQVTLMSSQDFRHRWDFHRHRETILRTDPVCSPCFQPFCTHRRCMMDISEEMVLQACQQMLSADSLDESTASPAFANSVRRRETQFESDAC